MSVEKTEGKYVYPLFIENQAELKTALGLLKQQNRWPVTLYGNFGKLELNPDPKNRIFRLESDKSVDTIKWLAAVRKLMLDIGVPELISHDTNKFPYQIIMEAQPTKNYKEYRQIMDIPPENNADIAKKLDVFYKKISAHPHGLSNLAKMITRESSIEKEKILRHLPFDTGSESAEKIFDAVKKASENKKQQPAPETKKESSNTLRNIGLGIAAVIFSPILIVVLPFVALGWWINNEIKVKKLDRSEHDNNPTTAKRQEHSAKKIFKSTKRLSTAAVSVTATQEEDENQPTQKNHPRTASVDKHTEPPLKSPLSSSSLKTGRS